MKKVLIKSLGNTSSHSCMGIELSAVLLLIMLNTISDEMSTISEARRTVALRGRAAVVSSAELVVDFLEKRLVEEELLLVHLSLANLDLLLFHLSLKEVLIVAIDLVYLVVKSTLLFRIILKVFMPHGSLFVIQSLLLLFAEPLFLHLLSKVFSHPLLLGLHLVHLSLVGHSLSELFFKLVTLDLLLFLLGT